MTDSFNILYAVKKHSIYVVILLIALLRIAGPIGKELWLDELHSSLVCSLSIKDIVQPGELGGYTPLYFIISKPFSEMNNDFVARLPSLFFGLISLYVIVLIYRNLFSKAFLIPLLLAGINPALLVFSSYHRMYSLYTLCASLMLYFWLSSKKNSLLWTVIFSAATCLTFPNGIFYVLTLLLLSIISNNKERIIKSIPSAIIALSLTFLYSFNGLNKLSEELSISTVNRFPFITSVSWLSLIKFYMSGPIGFMHPVLRIFAVVLAIIGVTAIFYSLFKFAKGNSNLSTLIVFLLLPPLFEFAFRLIDISMFQYKSYLPSSLAIILLVSVMCENIINGRYKIYGYFLLVILITLSLIIDLTWIDPSKPFSMKEPRNDRYLSLLQKLEQPIFPYENEGKLVPVVLSGAEPVLVAMRYSPHLQRILFAPTDPLTKVSIPGNYREMFFQKIKESEIKIIKNDEIPAQAFWIGDNIPNSAVLVTKSKAGIPLFYISNADQKEIESRSNESITQ